VRYAFFLVCAILIVLAVAFFLQLPFFINLWPFQGTTPLCGGGGLNLLVRRHPTVRRPGGDRPRLPGDAGACVHCLVSDGGRQRGNPLLTASAIGFMLAAIFGLRLLPTRLDLNTKTTDVPGVHGRSSTQRS
jgi:hypothetical protein